MSSATLRETGRFDARFNLEYEARREELKALLERTTRAQRVRLAETIPYDPDAAGVRRGSSCARCGWHTWTDQELGLYLILAGSRESFLDGWIEGERAGLARKEQAARELQVLLEGGDPQGPFEEEWLETNLQWWLREFVAEDDRERVSRRIRRCVAGHPEVLSGDLAWKEILALAE